MHQSCNAACEIKQDGAVCRRCGNRGQTVLRQTVESLLIPKCQSQLKPGAYFFDTSPDCDVVYFSNESDSYFTKNDLKVRVGIKATHDPIPVCYCFGQTVESIRAEIESTGRSTVGAKITKEIQIGNCACEAKNPSGRCCLGEINKAVDKLLVESRSRIQSRD